MELSYRIIVIVELSTFQNVQQDVYERFAEIRFIVQQLLLCRSKQHWVRTQRLSFRPAMNGKSYSSHFQKTHKRRTFLTPASGMQGAGWWEGLLGHIHPPSPAPLRLFCSLCSVPAIGMEASTGAHPTCNAAWSTQHPGDMDQARGFEEGKKKVFALEKVGTSGMGKFSIPPYR